MSAVSSVIHFFGVRCEHAFCSNFAPYPVTIDGVTWPTSEHYYQAQKFTDPAFRESIRAAVTPGQAKRMSRSKTQPRVDAWEAVRDEAMYRVVRAKFAQHAEIRAALLATGEAQLVEHCQRDAYWGDAGDGSGQNMLGRILMRVREEMRSEGVESGV